MRNQDQYTTGTVTKARNSLAVAIMLGTLSVGTLRAADESWPMFGQNIANTTCTSETTLSTSNVSKLKPKWIFKTGGDVSARAAVVNGVVYFPDWGGNIWAVDASNGKKVWTHTLSHYGFPSGTISRTSPAVADGKVYIGTQGGWLLAINAETGSLVWKSQPIPPSNVPQITGSPTVEDGVVYLGLTTDEEGLAENSHYVCCTTTGNVVAVNANNGTLLWATPTVPEGYSGAGIWSSGLVVDTSRETVFVTTGNNYSTPTAAAYLVRGCRRRRWCLPVNQRLCRFGSSANSKTGAVKWGKRLMQWTATTGTDDWNLACKTSPFTDCPVPTGPDFDFGFEPTKLLTKPARAPDHNWRRAGAAFTMR